MRSARRARPAGVDRRPLRVEGPRGRPRRRRAARGAGGARPVFGGRRHRAPLALRRARRADRRSRRRRVRRARAHGRHLGARRRRGRARSRAGRCARWPTPTTRASAGSRCSARWPGPSGSSRATRPPSSRARRPTRRRAAPGSSSPTVRGSSPPRRARSGPGRSSAGCSSWPRPTWPSRAPAARRRHPRGNAHPPLPGRNARSGAGIRDGSQSGTDAVEPERRPFDGTSARPYL